MKCIADDFRRAITGRWFLAAFFASVVSLYMSIGDQSYYLVNMLSEMEMYEDSFWLNAASLLLQGINFAGYVLTPDRFMTWLQLPREMQYYANLLSAWLSPLQHATYTMHNFGYDLLPRVQTSCLLLGVVSLLLMIVSALAMRRFSFRFTGGYSDE